MKRFSFALLFLTAGLIVGLVLSGRVRSEDSLGVPPTGAAATPPAAEQRSVAVPSTGPDFTRVAENTVHAVANISSVQVVRQRVSPFFNDPFFEQFFGGDEMFGSRNRYAQSLGSGVIVSSDGYVVTNNHVLGEGQIDRVSVSLADKRELPARIVGVDTWTDLALLKIDATNLPVIPWGDSAKLRVAEWVMAIGNPYQLNESVSLGIVSALGRANVGIAQYEDFIQTDAAINPGNSGGALINSRGELIGINTAIFSQSGGYQGVGFAVPSNLVRRVVDDLIKYGSVRRGSVGIVEVQPLTSRLADELRAPKVDGVVVTRLLRDGAAYKNGIKPGDVIVAVNGASVADPAQFVRLIADSQIGSTARVDVVRDGQRQTLRIPIEAQNPQRRRQR